jgi:hypothetical protein
VEFDDGDGGVIGDGEDSFAGVCGADAEVVHAACSAEAHFAEGVEAVVSEPVVPGLSVSWRCCFRSGVVGVGRGAATEFTVWSSLVVDVTESVELAL